MRPVMTANTNPRAAMASIATTRLTRIDTRLSNVHISRKVLFNWHFVIERICLKRRSSETRLANLVPQAFHFLKKSKSYSIGNIPSQSDRPSGDTRRQATA
jgi:hypothetical protein